MTLISKAQIRYAWVDFQPDATINDKKDVASVAKNSTGNFTVIFSNDFSNVYYPLAILPQDSTSNPINVKVISRTVNTVTFELRGGATVILGIGVVSDTPIDPNIGISVIGFE